MNEFSKITYYDLRSETLAGRTPAMIGRIDDTQRLTRIINRKLHNNCLVVGPSGIGKSTFVYGFIHDLVYKPEYSNRNFVQIEADNFFNLSATSPYFLKYLEAFENLPPCVLVIDNFGSLVFNHPTILQNMIRLLQPVVESAKVQVVLVLEPHEYKWLQGEEPAYSSKFEVLELKNQVLSEQMAILQSTFKNFAGRVPETKEVSSLELIIKYAERFGTLGQLPSSAIKILDEALAQGKVSGSKLLTEIQVNLVVSDKANIPLNQLNSNEIEMLKKLEPEMNKRVIGQGSAIAKFVSTIQRAKLGLKNPNRPLGSFLVLGPSGVGKTETAKLLAEKIYGKKTSFIRIDMSEFGQEHTVQRLIGAPPGYVGYDEGGALTNAVKNEPYSLVLLDEIEKANHKVFDIFLQILDDGRLTSGQSETIDFSQTIIMATSNLAVNEIIAGSQNGEDIFSRKFLETKIMPALTRAFRLEFINRFDAVVIFKPLGLPELLDIAALEIKKIEERVSKHKIKFNFDPKILAKQIQHLTDPRFGARPVKRFIEETCETLITRSLLK